MSILIVGGCGFIGSNVVYKLIEKSDDNIVVLDKNIRKIDFLLPYTKDRITFEKGDINDLPKLFEIVKKHGVNGIIHAAAFIGFKNINENPYTSFKINVESTLNILEITRILDLNKVLYISSGAVYGKAKAPVTEDNPLNPGDMYGMQKSVAELIGLQYSNTYNIDFVSTRLYFVYGRGLIIDMPEAVFKPPISPIAVLYTLINYTLKRKPFISEEGGDSKLDYTFVNDAANGIILAYMKKKPKHKIFNISSGKAYSLTDIALILNKLGGQINFGPGELKDWPPRGTFLDISRANKELGYTPQYSLEDGLKEYYNWLKSKS